MNKREAAKKLLKFFGKNGKRWQPRAAFPFFKQAPRVCLLEGAARVVPDSNIKDEFYRLLPGEYAGLCSWNDRQTWPTIRRLLTSIRDGHPERFKP